MAGYSRAKKVDKNTEISFDPEFQNADLVDVIFLKFMMRRDNPMLMNDIIWSIKTHYAYVR